MVETLLDFSGGLASSTSPFLQTKNTLTVGNGVNPSYKLGQLIKDCGYIKQGTGLESGKNVLGLFDFRQDSSTQKMLATMDDSTSDDTQLFYRTTGNWTEIAAAETAWANYAGINVEMESFINYCFFVGYGASDGYLPVGSLTGTTFSTATNVTSMPKAKYIRRYRDRLYIANCYNAANQPYRIYFSSVPSAGAITWTVATDFIDVDFSEELTGLGTNWDRLVAFTEKSAYIYDQSQFRKAWDQGGYHRTIQNSGPYMIFANRDGAWVSTGGQPENISGNVIDFFRNSNPANWLSATVDEEYRIFVGNVTVNGISYTNCMLTFNIPSRAWRTRELYNTPTSMEGVLRSGQKRLSFGSSAFVYDYGKASDSTPYVSDASDGTATGSGAQPIHANFECAPLYTGDLEGQIKKIIAFADKAVGLKLRARAIDRNKRILTPYMPLGQLTQYVNSFDVEVDKGILIQVAGSEYSMNSAFSFYGLQYEVEKFSTPTKNK